MTKLHSAIAIAALTSASSVSSVAALSLQRQPMKHNRVSSRSGNRRATATTQWMLPNHVKSTFGQLQQRSSRFLPFYAIMEKPKDGSSSSSDEEAEEEEEEEKAWVVPTPPSNPPPPKPVITESRVAAAKAEENVLGEKIASEFINPLFVNPTIKKNVPTDITQGAFINGSFIAVFTAYLIYGPFIPLLQTIVAALSIGVITSYVSITEGTAGEFVRGVGKFTKDVTDTAVAQVGEWQESGKLDEVSKTVSKTIGSGAKTLMDAATKEYDESVAARKDEPIVQLTEGLTAEEAEMTRKSRVDGKPFAFEEIALPSQTPQVAEGMTADEAEVARKGRLNEDKKVADEKRAASAEAKMKAEEEAKAVTEAEANKKAEDEAKAAAEVEAKKKADEEAEAVAEADAKQKAENEAKAAAEADAKKKAEEEAKATAEAVAKQKAEDEAKAAAEGAVKQKAEDEAKAADEAKEIAEAEAKQKAAAEAEATKKAAEEQARKQEEARLAEFARLADENRIKEEAEQRAAEQAQQLEEARRLEEQAEAAREAVRLMAEQEALMADDEEDDDDFMDDDDWEASVLLANELAGIDGGSEDAKIMDKLLKTEMGGLSEEEEAALGKAARAAVLKYEQEMDERGSTPVVEEEEGEIFEPEVVEPVTKGANIDYSSMSVSDLKDILRSKGLKVGGKKAELIERLEES